MPQTLVLTEADQNSTRTAAVGQNVTIQLAENPTTGYVWALTAEPAKAADVTGSEYALSGRCSGRQWTT